MVPELVAAYGFSWRKAAPRPHVSTQTDKIKYFQASSPKPPVELRLSAVNEQLAMRCGLSAGALRAAASKSWTAFVRPLDVYLSRELTGQFYPTIEQYLVSSDPASYRARLRSARGRAGG